jgi:3,4-dehydroadipyl-CoA semialdehyde dehydrogenase
LCFVARSNAQSNSPGNFFMSELLANYFGGRWQSGRGHGSALIDPVLGDELVRVDATGLDLAAGFAYAREQGGAALRALTYAERAAMLAKAVAVLNQHRDRYYEIATANSGTVKSDSAIDIDGGIYTLGYYAKLGESLGARRFLLDGDAARLGKDPLFQSQHVLTPTRGVALFINAFNFPSWGLWEKAAPALLSGVPVIVKPATATAWLTQQMVKDVVDANIFPTGALSVVCGSSAGLMDQLQPFDVISFTGSAETAQTIRSHPAISQRSTRVNIEADSINSALLISNDEVAFDLFVKEVSRNHRQERTEVHGHSPCVRTRSALHKSGRGDRCAPRENNGGQSAQRASAHGRTRQSRPACVRARGFATTQNAD